MRRGGVEYYSETFDSTQGLQGVNGYAPCSWARASCERGDLVNVRANAGGGDDVSQEIGVCGAKLDLGGGKFELVIPKAFDKGADVGDVGHGVGIEDHDVVKVGRHAIEVLDDLADDLHKPPGRGVAILRHDEPLGRVGWECRRRWVVSCPC